MSQLIAFVQLPPQSGIALIAARADALGAHVALQEGVAVIQANSGTITASPRDSGIELALASESAEGLQMLRAAIDGFAAQSGIPAPDWQSAAVSAGGATGAPSRLIATRVIGKTRISPSYYRIRLGGSFEPFLKGGLHFRLLIGPEGAAAPEAGPEGIVWPEGIEAWHRPPYTVRRIGAQGDWLDFDVFLHEGGRVTEWCLDIAPGDRVMLTGPGGRGVKQAAWMGIIGDETALPVVLRALEAAPAGARGEAAILISDPADIQPVTLPAGITLRWILRGDGPGLTALLAALPLPAQDRFVFFAGERTEAEAARLWAKAAGLGSGEFHAAAYWTAGWQPPASQRQALGRALTPADAAQTPADR